MELCLQEFFFTCHEDSTFVFFLFLQVLVVSKPPEGAFRPFEVEELVTWP